MVEVMVQIWATLAEQGKPLDTAPQLSIAEVKHSVSEAEFAVFFTHTKPGPGRGAQHSFPSLACVKNPWSYNSTLPYILIPW
jgi:hypothetical protein